jgi:hypothetical protein
MTKHKVFINRYVLYYFSHYSGRLWMAIEIPLTNRLARF